MFDEFKSSKADIVEALQDCSWGMREMLVRDLDGNTLRIGCELENCEATDSEQ